MIIAVILFVAVLFFTELSPFSSRAVALVNGGYGTFDMKSYDANTFIRVMEATTDFSAYLKYYICDFLFILAFLNVMIQLVRGFHGQYIKSIQYISCIVAVIRGILDMVENIVLLYLILGYPDVNSTLADVCNVITRVKFYFMRGWFALFFVMVCLQWFFRKVIDNRSNIS